VELKRLSNFLVNEQLNPNRVVCGMFIVLKIKLKYINFAISVTDVVENKLMRFNFLSDSFNLQYFLPGVVM